MFQSPKANTFVAPAEPIDVNQRYLLKVADLVDMGPSKFADPNDANPAHQIQWRFRMATLQGAPVLDVDGNPYEHYDYTSNKTGKGSKTATARLWMEALLGPLEDADIGAGIVDRLKGKVAIALFDEKQSGGQDGQESYTRVKILKLAPYVQKKPAAASAPAPKPAPEPEPDVVPF